MSQYMFAMLHSNRRSGLPTSLIDKISTQLFSKDAQTLNDNMLATHTYLGQMLSHELVPATDGSGRRAKAKLDLDSLYGSSEDERIYFDSEGNFLTGKDSAGNPDCDLLRLPNVGTAIIPEPRNDENLLISQLHLFWQRVHNKIAKLIRKKNNQYSRSQIVSASRKYVVYLFHRVIVEDFLNLLLQQEVHKEYFEKQKQYFLAQRQVDIVPFEFSMACFRLGHSMVRPFYELQPGRGKKDLSQLLRHVRGNTILESEVVDWAHLEKLHAKRIDHFLTDAMRNIPALPGGQACMSHTQIVEANLAAGRNAQLPSPETIIDKLVSQQHPLVEILGFDVKTYQEVHQNLIGFNITDFPDGKLPMWLYILFEAKTFGGNGNRLGPLGSVVVAETLSHCIRRINHSWFESPNIDVSLLPKTLISKQTLTFHNIISWLEA